MVRLLMILCLLAVRGSAAAVVFEGSRVHYESYGQGTDALVFIHGWTCDLTFWRGQAPLYEKHRSLLIDLPGHGQSDKPDVAYTQEHFARAVEAVMRDAGVRHAVLIGHSMGGPVALTFLRLFPSEARALVLVDSFIPQGRDKRVDELAQKLRGPNSKEQAGGMIASMFSDKTPAAMREEIRSKMLAAPPHVMASAFEGMFGMEPPRPGETYALPVLAIVAHPGSESQVRKTFPNLRKFEVWKGSGHFLMMESPARFNREVEKFLASLPHASAAQ